MRFFTRFVLTVLNSLGGIGPLSMGGTELPGIPQPPLPPEWIDMSVVDFPFSERGSIENAKSSATNVQDWKQIYQKLDQLLTSKKLTSTPLAILLNNMAYSAHKAENRNRAQLIIRKADQIQVSNREVTRKIKRNLGIFG